MKKRNLAVGIGLAALSAISIVATSIVATSCSKQVTIKQVDAHQLYDIDTENKTYKLHGSSDSAKPLIMDANGLVYADQNKTDLIAYLPVADESGSMPTEITIPASVRLISNAYTNQNGANEKFVGTFENNSTLTKIIFEKGSELQSIKSFAFDNATKLANFEYVDAADTTQPGLPTTLISIGNAAFRKTALGSSIDLNNVVEIGESAFEGVTGIGFNVNLSASLKILGSSAFKNSSLTKLDLSLTSLTSLPANCFTGSKIKEVSNATTNKGVKLPTSITDISNAFQGATLLETVTLGSAVKNISSFAFDGCTKLNSVNLKISKITNIPASAFQGCTSLVSLTLPDALTTISEDAFKGCTGLQNLTLGNSLTTIGATAFKGCTSLQTLSFPASLTTIANQAFDGCTKLTTVDFAANNTKLTSIG